MQVNTYEDDRPTIKCIPESIPMFKHQSRFEVYWKPDETHDAMNPSWITNPYYFEWAYWLHSTHLTDHHRDASDYVFHMDYERKVRDSEWK